MGPLQEVHVIGGHWWDRFRRRSSRVVGCLGGTSTLLVGIDGTASGGGAVEFAR